MKKLVKIRFSFILLSIKNAHFKLPLPKISKETENSAKKSFEISAKTYMIEKRTMKNAFERKTKKLAIREQNSKKNLQTILNPDNLLLAPEQPKQRSIHTPKFPPFFVFFFFFFLMSQAGNIDSLD